ncbi:hypothetical protein AMEJIAPC_03600 [Caulobacter sp. NIBR1757]|nr:hypothetical protein AMEJIAPC_03600 [Caulobacter sp. NIBR1757]
MRAPVAVVVQDPRASGAELLDRAIALSGFRTTAAALIAHALEATGDCAAIVVPALDAYAAGSPAATDPALVEHLLDLLFDLGATSADVGSTRGTAAVWLENRDVFVAADLLGYRYETPRGRPYDVIDLAEDAEPGAFPLTSPLAGAGLSRRWREAGLRLVFSANRTDEDDGYALCLATLASVLPQVDKDYHYRHRRDPGAVVAALAAAAPPHFAFIDAVVSGHGSGGGRDPRALRTGAVIGASTPALADYLGALKMGLDPFVSTLAAPSLRQARQAPGLRMLGPLEPYEGWVNVDPALLASTAARRGFVEADRSIRPVLQQVDRELFPFRDPATDWLNNALTDTGGQDAVNLDGGLLTLVNLWLAEVGKAGEAWGVLFDKDALRRREAPVNIDPEAVSDGEYDALAGELLPQADLLRGLRADAEGIRWRFDDGAVLFDGARRIALPFDLFCQAVEIHRTIQFMNDYIGGQALVTARDKQGRALRQIERNLYLPQPNYTALGGGVTIDVTKIEAMEYGPRRQRMFWKTVKSENQSALADDGVVTFEAVGEDTLVTIWGRQHFRLSPLWSAIDAQLTPDLKRTLVSEAYARFFKRTFANLEAVAEGRDVRIGRPWSDAAEGEPLPVERLTELARKVQEGGALDLAAMLKNAFPPAPGGRPEPVRIDADGFRHFDGATSAQAARGAVPARVAGLLRDLRHAADIDAGTRS